MQPDQRPTTSPSPEPSSPATSSCQTACHCHGMLHVCHILLCAGLQTNNEAEEADPFTAAVQLQEGAPLPGIPTTWALNQSVPEVGPNSNTPDDCPAVSTGHQMQQREPTNPVQQQQDQAVVNPVQQAAGAGRYDSCSISKECRRL